MTCSMQTRDAYRADIDGLRAFAILPVVLYHAGVAGFPGGFVGVDVFFVISGYLISRIIYAETSSGQFSVAAFYGRRARRLLPAFLTVSALTMIAGALLLLPQEFTQLADSLLWSTLFSGNVFFWLQNNYFGPDALTQPLLHYWSLGVEEQFYFVFPWLALVLVGRARGFMLAVLALLAALSLGLCQWMLSISPESAFYLLPFRAWEMLAGCIIAAPGFPPVRNERVAAGAAVLGILAILVATMAYSSETRFPGLAALVPVLGAALVIWGGGVPNSASRWIGAGPLVYIGAISYSLYLVHWPVTVFTRLLAPDASVNQSAAVIVAVSLASAAMIYRWVETPTRKSDYWTAQRIVTLAKTGLAGCIALAGTVIVAQGFPDRFSPEVQRLLNYSFDHETAYRDRICFLYPDQGFSELAQQTCLPKADNVALLWGDSLGAHLTPALKPLLEERGYVFAQATSGSCRPIVGLEIAARPNCRVFNDEVFAWVKQNRPREIILAAGWSDAQADQALLEPQLEALQAAGAHVTIIGRPPQFERSVPTILAYDAMAGRSRDLSRATPPDWMVKLDQDMAQRFGSLANYVPVMKMFCPDRRCMLADANGQPLYWDKQHLTDVGARMAIARLDAFLPGPISETGATSSIERHR